MKRFYIFEGDKTSSGGKPIASQGHSTWHGRKYIMLDDKVYCPACKKIGTVVGQGPRLNDNWMGQHPALNDDICVCDCRPAPKMIAYQDNDWQMMTAEEVTAQGFRAQNTLSTENTEEKFDLHFQIRGDKTDKPLGNIPYKIKLENGQEIIGTTDANGFTKLVSNDAALITRIEVPYYGNSSTTQIDPCLGHDACHC
ncbi:PAAR domain-containing protein [Herbaspirillum hiltneri]|uniref:PAAR domain-containing protein n=1 Tax=Herbaspirillum hiltneri TaxID=341045 RepID=UPI00069D71F1|nr:PAAR domain-containing protein [Herbaspirillum hiltneri]